MKSHHIALTTLLATVGVTVLAVVGLSRASETYGTAVAAYRDASEIDATLVLSAGTEIAQGRSNTGLSAAFESADDRASEAVSRLEASSPWWDAIGHPERKRLIELAREERDLVKSVGESVRRIGQLPPEQWSDELGKMRQATAQFENVHEEVMRIGE